MQSKYEPQKNRNEMIKKLNPNNNQNIKRNKNNKQTKINKNNNNNSNNNSKIKDLNNSNNYYNVINNEKEEEENNKKIKEIEEQIKLKREEKIKKIELLNNTKNKELLKLEIKVLRKLYGDLFIRIPNTFKQNNLTFENFVYEFGQEIHELFEFDKTNPSYDNLLRDVNILVIQKYPISPDLTKFNRRELKKYFYDLGINDDWALIERYKSEMDKKEEKERLMKIADSMKDYYNSLNAQIEEKKNIDKKEDEKKEEEKRKKQKEIDKIKIMNQKKIEQLKENEKLMEMLNRDKYEKISENEKIKKYYLNNLEEENNNMNENNIDLVRFKLDNAMAIQTRQMDNYNQKYLYQPKVALNTGYSIPDDQISYMVDQIMLKKKQQYNKYQFLDLDNEYKEEEDNNINQIIENENNEVEVKLPDYNNLDGIDLDLEKKVNKILEKQRI